jgi:hypothetical protein
MWDKPVARPLPTHRTTQIHIKCTQTSMPWVGFEPTIPAFERRKTIHALDSVTTMIGNKNNQNCIIDLWYCSTRLVLLHHYDKRKITRTFLMSAYWSRSTDFEITKTVLNIHGVHGRPLHLHGERKRKCENATSYTRMFTGNPIRGKILPQKLECLLHGTFPEDSDLLKSPSSGAQCCVIW